MQNKPPCFDEIKCYEKWNSILDGGKDSELIFLTGSHFHC